MAKQSFNNFKIFEYSTLGESEREYKHTNTTPRTISVNFCLRDEVKARQSSNFTQCFECFTYHRQSLPIELPEGAKFERRKVLLDCGMRECYQIVDAVHVDVTEINHFLALLETRIRRIMQDTETPPAIRLRRIRSLFKDDM
jgi:hypothetical protein